VIAQRAVADEVPDAEDEAALQDLLKVKLTAGLPDTAEEARRELADVERPLGRPHRRIQSDAAKKGADAGCRPADTLRSARQSGGRGCCKDDVAAVAAGQPRGRQGAAGARGVNPASEPHNRAELSSTSSLPPSGSKAHTGITAAGAGSKLGTERSAAASAASANGAPTDLRRWSMTSPKP